MRVPAQVARPPDEGHAVAAGSRDVALPADGHATNGAAPDENAGAIEGMRRLLALTRALSGARTRREVARVAIRHGRAALGAPRGYVYVLAPGVATADLVAAAGYPPAVRGHVRALDLSEPRPAAAAMRLGEESWVDDLVSEAEAVDAAAPATGSRGTAAIPLVDEGRVVGAVGFSFTEPHHWSDGEQALLRAIGGLVAQAMERVAAIEARDAERRRQLVNQAYLAEASAVLASSLEWEETLRTVARLAVPRIADWCSIELLEGEAHSRLVVEHPGTGPASYPATPPPRVTGRRPRTGPAAVIRTGQSQLVPELGRRELEAIGGSDGLRAVLEAVAVPSLMCVPLHGRSGVLGAITFVAAVSGRRFGPDDLAIAEGLAVRAASAIENARVFRDADRFRRMIDAHTDVVLLFDPETLAVRYANHGAAAAVGRPQDDLVGIPASDLFDDADADGLRKLVRPITEGRADVRTLVLRLASSTGSVPMEVLVQGVRLPGEPLAALAIARDVSERLETASRLRRLAEAEHSRAAELNAVIRAMGDGVLVCAPDGTVTLANPAVGDVLGSAGAPVTYADLLGRLEDREAAPVLGTRGGPVELRLEGAEERWVELATYPVGVMPGDERNETIVVVRDVTDARLAQAVRETFVGVLSHELRTPITTIFGGSKVLARNPGLSDEARDAIFTDIQVEAERLHRLVEDVIALTRFGEDGIEIGHEPVLLQRILPGIVRAEEARWPGLTFSLDVAPGMPTVIADPTYVEQVVRNLLSNAAKYGGDGAHVRTIAEATTSEVMVRIVDDGPGFSPEEADRLFELYFRSPRTATRVSGAGIGLFVCARLIRAMGGRIWAGTPEEGGAEFGFALLTMDDDEAV